MHEDPDTITSLGLAFSDPLDMPEIFLPQTNKSRPKALVGRSAQAEIVMRKWWVPFLSLVSEGVPSFLVHKLA